MPRKFMHCLTPSHGMRSELEMKHMIMSVPCVRGMTNSRTVLSFYISRSNCVWVKESGLGMSGFGLMK